MIFYYKGCKSLRPIQHLLSFNTCCHSTLVTQNVEQSLFQFIFNKFLI